MGLYDTITCEKSLLPLPADLKELSNVDFNNLSFQTKDLVCYMGVYEIRASGALYEQKTEKEWVDVPNSMFGGHFKTTKSWWEPYNYTGEIVFYTSVGDEDCDIADLENDYWLEFSFYFENGFLTKKNLIKFEPTPNKERKERYEKFKKEMAEEKTKRNIWYNKYFYIPLWEKPVRKIFRKLHHWAQQATNSIFKIERFLIK